MLARHPATRNSGGMRFWFPVGACLQAIWVWKSMISLAGKLPHQIEHLAYFCNGCEALAFLDEPTT